MQKISFRTVEEHLEFLPEDELKIVLLLRSIVLNCIPDVVEKLSYNVPFYKRNKNICFIWAASVTWGNKKTYEGVRFGFTEGYLLQDEIGYLEKGNRKQVYWKTFADVKQIDIDLLKAYLCEAVEIDIELKKKKKY
jgi:hypothetical protein